ncbi:fimbrial biogenesis chaperone [Burkholderia gladioli]|uniref:fimbrial biogenesis chaperone n=1 Tax=Burkholderia gladioli TaxID=28095 RepID=UPI00163FBC2C|nr:fimbria/pilus periplasmic chaperone [Burkholderia gladioli]MDN7494768.1 fimbria/pilus periplasmic chaperone [Burkholderia gladioli]
MSRTKSSPIARSWLALIALLCCACAQASVTLSGTRVVFDASEPEVTIQLSNQGKQPALIQAWLDTGDERAEPERIEVPFMVTPTLFRIEAGKGQALRIIHTGEPLPSNRESLFWLNVLDVPPKASGGDEVNRLQFAFRTRIKMMYRPADLPGTPDDAPASLRWTLATDASQRPVLQARNPSAYVVNLAGVELQSGGKTYSAGFGHVLPGETASFPLVGADSTALPDATVLYSSVDDWGSTHGHRAAVGR